MGIIIAIGIFFLIYLLWKKGLIRSLFEPKISKIYALLIMHLNQYAFQNIGTPTFINNRQLKIYKTDRPQILYLELNQNDDLQIEWRYKYYQQEMIFRYTVKRVAFDTYDMAKTEFYFNDIIQKFNEKLALHKKVIDNKGIPEEMLSEFGISSQNLKNARKFLGQDKIEEKDKKTSNQSVVVKKETVRGKECIAITVSIENKNISIWNTISETNSNMIDYKSFRSKQFSLGSNNFYYATPLQPYIDNITFISDYLNKNGMTDENLEEALYLLCKKHIVKNNRMIDNDLYGLVDVVLILKCAITLHYKQPMSEQQLELQFLQLLQSCLPRIKDSVYVTKYNLSNPLQPIPYLEKMV